MPKTIVVVGAGSGIGAVIARANAEEDLYLTANRHFDALKTMAPRAAFAADLAQENAAPILADAILTHISKDQATDCPRIDALVVAAGVDLMTQEHKALDFDARLAKAWRVDVASTVAIARTIGNAMAKNQRGAEIGTPTPSVVLFGWSGVRRGQEGETAQIYSTCKGAVVAFARSLAQDLAPYVRVNTVSPGWIRTTWGAAAPDHINRRVQQEALLRRWGEPNEIADAVNFLISEKASYVNGQNIEVDGGFSCRK